jgi:hypothetical protein
MQTVASMIPPPILHDLYPALVIAAADGVARIESSRRNVTLTGLLAMLSVISVASTARPH